MKTGKAIFYFGAVFVFTVISCTKLPWYSDVRVKDITTGECKNSTLKSVFPDYPEALVLKTGKRHVLEVTHINAVFNCCLPAGISVEAEIRNDSLFLMENEKEPGICNCICPYDVNYSLSPLEYRDYVFVLLWPDGAVRETFSFTFNENTDIRFSIENK